MPTRVMHQQLPAAPRPVATTRPWSQQAIETETERLFLAIGQPNRWDRSMCELIAPLTLEINARKQEMGVFLMAHSYQTPDIVYGVADAVGDSYGLAKQARDATEDTILFSSVRFMAETAKIVNPEKRVLHPSPNAGCSLADGITPEDVRALRKRFPGVPVACYVNTSAAVKAECDVCVTSSNYLDIARSLPGDELVFVPDRLMGVHLQNALRGEKTVHIFDATCEVHDQFTGENAKAWREAAAGEGRDLVILAHPECTADVLEEADFVGSSEKMMDYARQLEAEGRVDVMPVTECGTADRMRAEIKGLNVMGACVMCRYMKKTSLADILQALVEPSPEQVIEIPEETRVKAEATLTRMFELAG